MTQSEVDTLKAALNDPAQASKHDRIRAVLAEQAPQRPPELRRTPDPKAFAGTAIPTAAPAPPPEKRSRLGEAMNTAAMLVNEGMNTASLGLTRGITDELSDATGVRIGPGPDQFDKLHQEHPDMTALANLGGALTGMPRKIALEAGRLADPLLMALTRRATSAAGRVGAQAVAGGLAGAGANAYTQAGRTLVDTGNSEAAGRAALSAIPSGAAFGAGFSALAGSAGEAAGAIGRRSPDIQALDRAGLEPSPIPGRPVVRKDVRLRSQLPILSEPPLVGRVSPETRGAAARAAADEIVPHIQAREKANNQRFGQLQDEAYAAQGDRPADYKPLIADIKRRLADERLPDATRGALTAVLGKFDQYIPKPPPPAPEPVTSPEIANFETMLAGAKSPVVRQGLERAIAEARARAPQPPPPEPVPEPPPFTAKSLDAIRDYADSKVRSKEISAKDVPFLQLRERMRSDLEPVAPQITNLNKQQSEVMKGFSKSKALLGMKRNQRGEGEDVPEAVARRVRERGEETATSGVRRGVEGHAVERAGRLGPPAVLPGTTGLPDDISYQATLDVPRLQLAQENLQLSPSQMFSGGGRAVASNMARMAANVPLRLAYPTLRRAGNSELGGKATAADDLLGAIQRRRDKKKRSGAEMSREGER